MRGPWITAHKHHLLFVGPRGCGKTHLVTLIVSRLSKDDQLTDRLRIAWLNEDETCTTLLEFLFKIHAALEKRYPAEFLEEMLSTAYEMKRDEALEFVSRHLLASLGSRTLLVVTENLDAIFEGLGNAGQKQLRSFIQENPRFSIVATAQRLVEDLSNRTSPFFGFFQTEHLKPLNVEQATELLQNIARLRAKSGVVEFLGTSRGHSRVRAIHHLSGGNHRIYFVLSQFITRDTVDALLEPFMKMVDELTPYYQERIRWLPPMQRKIVEYLCVCEGTARMCRISVSQCGCCERASTSSRQAERIPAFCSRSHLLNAQSWNKHSDLLKMTTGRRRESNERQIISHGTVGTGCGGRTGKGLSLEQLRDTASGLRAYLCLAGERAGEWCRSKRRKKDPPHGIELFGWEYFWIFIWRDFAFVDRHTASSESWWRCNQWFLEYSDPSVVESPSLSPIATAETTAQARCSPAGFMP